MGGRVAQRRRERAVLEPAEKDPDSRDLPPKTVWLRIVRGRVVETFTSHTAANASEDQEHIHPYVLEE